MFHRFIYVWSPDHSPKSCLMVLRSAIGDYRQELPRATLNQISERNTSRQWSKYITSSTAIKLINNDCTRIAKDLKDSWYINDRLVYPKRGKFINKANTRIGNHSLRNRLQDLNSLTFDWIGIYSDKYLRKNLFRYDLVIK